METLQEKFSSPGGFLVGVELVSTRGSMEDRQARHARSLASELTRTDRIDWVSITDNAGGNPQLSPMALGRPMLVGEPHLVRGFRELGERDVPQVRQRLVVGVGKGPNREP